MLKPSQVCYILKDHDSYWEDQRPRMQELKRAYMTQYWARDKIDHILRTEVAKGFATVESYLGALYAKNPAVSVGPDLRAQGNPEVAQATANQYLGSIREVVEDATRLALIFPSAAVKLSPVESVDPLKRVATSALPPWEVVVDVTAGSWDQQRYVGHVFLLPVSEAMSRYGRREARFTPRAYSRWLEGGPVGLYQTAEADSEKSWVRVLELYDLEADKLLVWSPDYKDGEDFLFKGVKVQIGALPEVPEDETPGDLTEEVVTVTETTGIPFKSASGRPVVPILPLYLSRDPETPLRGYSLLARIYDQIRELNVMRTYQSQGVRRMARQWLMRAGFLEEDGAAKIIQGLDGEFIEVNIQPGTPLEGNIIPVPQAPIPGDIAAYANTVELDIQQSGVNAPFVSGQATGVTATENRLLQEYTSSQLGRMARTRDSLITSIAQTYNIMLSVILGDEAEPLRLPNPVGPTMLSAADLTGDFAYYAVDSGSTPMGDAAKRDSLTQLAGTLVQLGAPAAAVLKELVRVYDLPESFSQILEPEAPPSPPEDSPLEAPPEEEEL